MLTESTVRAMTKKQWLATYGELERQYRAAEKAEKWRLCDAIGDKLTFMEMNQNYRDTTPVFALTMPDGEASKPPQQFSI